MAQQLYFWEFIPEKWKFMLQNICIQMFKAAVFVVAPKLETIQVFSNRWMMEPTVALQYQGLLLRSRKKRSIDTCSNREESPENYA